MNLLASGEMILADAWQPAVMAVKAQGIECSYATMKNGYRAWSIGISPAKTSPNLEAVTAYADYWLSGPPGDHRVRAGLLLAHHQRQGRHGPRQIRLLVRRQALGRRDERGIKEGDLRDGGSLEERAANVGYWHQWPDEYDLLILKWDEFLSA